MEKTGKVSPDLFGGFSTGLTYKRFDVNAVFGYAIGGKIYNYSRQEYDSDGTYTDRNQMKLRPEWNRWEKPGDIATHPIARYNNQDKGNATSTRIQEWIQKFQQLTAPLWDQQDLQYIQVQVDSCLDLTYNSN